MKVGIAGGRNYGSRAEEWRDDLTGATSKWWAPYQPEIDYLNQTLDAIHVKKPITCVIHGNATGADNLAKLWAIKNKVKQIPYNAEWDIYGSKAGPLRNARMMDENPDIQCWIYFNGGKGTDNCIKQARLRKLNILDLRNKP